MCAKPSLYLILLCVLKCILLVSEESPPTWVTWDYTVSSADDQPWSQGPHRQLYWGPARESGTTHPVLLRTSPGVRDHTANSVEDQPGSQGPHSQLCWGTAWVSWTIWHTLLRNSLGVMDHSPMCDQSIEEWRSFSGKNWLIRQGVLIRDN